MAPGIESCEQSESSAPKPAGPMHLFSISWVMARAFTNNPVQAVAAMPAAIMKAALFMIRRVAYQSADGNGVVIFGRHRPRLDALLTAVVIVLFTFIFGGVFYLFLRLLNLMFELLFNIDLLMSIIVVMVLLFSVFAFFFYGMIAFTHRVSNQVFTGMETPKGDRYVVAILAQRPGTKSSALLLARSLIRSLPPGKVVVSRAGSEKVAERFRRMGFTLGNGLRLNVITK